MTDTNKTLADDLTVDENDLRDALRKADALAGALELACELLPVPEHCQDAEWYKKEARVYDALAAYKEQNHD